MIERQIQKLQLQSGAIPFDEWFENLSDQRMKIAVDSRLARVRAGNLGDAKSVGDGVFELRLPIGPGLRIYYGLKGREVVILIGGGDKSSQQRDIRRAKQLWKSFLKV